MLDSHPHLWLPVVLQSVLETAGPILSEISTRFDQWMYCDSAGKSESFLSGWESQCGQSTGVRSGNGMIHHPLDCSMFEKRLVWEPLDLDFYLDCLFYPIGRCMALVGASKDDKRCVVSMNDNNKTTKRNGTETASSESTGSTTVI